MATYVEQQEERQDRKAFWESVDQATLYLMEEGEQFYSYFLFQMGREIKEDIGHPTAVYFKGAKYVMAFNPSLFLSLTKEQRATSIKHEIHHILALHLIRGEEVKEKYSSLAINTAMDLVVNHYLDYLPPYALTLEKINNKYQLKLPPYESFEYYVEQLQLAFDLLEEDDEGEEHDTEASEEQMEDDLYDAENIHTLWESSDQIDERTLYDFTEQALEKAQLGKASPHLEAMIQKFASSKGEVPWHQYLHQLMGSVAMGKKKTTTRRSRRQPERLDLRGNLPNHQAQLAVAFDMSTSMSQEDFDQAMQEVLNLVRIYRHGLTVIECDDRIQRTYVVKSARDLKERLPKGGGTKFSPVFDYGNQANIQLLVYFTDGQGEAKLTTIPRGYKVLWVITGQGDKLSVDTPYGIIKKLSATDKKETGIDMSDVRSDGYSMNHQAPIW
ncbi:MAG: vWA domain-containing protein [Cellulosilyticaceae bacterium]